MSLSYFVVPDKLNSSQSVGHILALPDPHLRKIVIKYEEFLAKKNEIKTETAEEPQVENQVNEIPVIEEPQVVSQPEATLEEISNTEINSESQEVLASDPVMAISPEPEMDSISPVVEQSVEEPVVDAPVIESPVVDDNSLNKAIENANMGEEVFPFVQEPIVPEQSSVTDVIQPEAQIENATVSNSSETSEFDVLQNNVISIFDKLKAKEKQLNDKENELKAKEEQLKTKEIELENERRQVLEDKLNNDALSQVLVQTRESWEQNGVQVPNTPDYPQTQMSDFTETNDLVTIQDAPEEGPTLTLAQSA